MHVDAICRHKEVDTIVIARCNLHIKRLGNGHNSVGGDILADKTVEIREVEAHRERFHLVGINIYRFATDFAAGEFFHQYCGKFEAI